MQEESEPIKNNAAICCGAARTTTNCTVRVELVEATVLVPSDGSQTVNRTAGTRLGNAGILPKTTHPLCVIRYAWRVSGTPLPVPQSDFPTDRRTKVSDTLLV